MKHLLVLSALCLSFFLKAQPTLTLTNVSGSNVISCYTPSITMMAGIVGPQTGFTFTWTSASNTLTGSSVILNTAGAYTVTASAPATPSVLTQYLNILSNTISPTSTLTPLVQNINCGTNANFTGMGSSQPGGNLMHTWTSPYSAGMAVSGGGISVYSPQAVGIFTYCVTDITNGCSTIKTATVTSSSAFPTCSITSANGFSLGCGTSSVTNFGILNAMTIPPGSAVSYTLLPPGFNGGYLPGPVPAFTTAIPGTYTVVVKDNSNLCEIKIPISVIQDISMPVVTVPTPSLNCNLPGVILTAGSNVAANFTWNNGPISVFGPQIPVNLSANINGSVAVVYTLTATGLSNNCKSTTLVTVYQNQVPPVAVIAGGGFISCNTPSVVLINASISPNPSPGQAPITSSWFGPAPQAPSPNTSSYLGSVPGTYTMIAVDQNNGCQSVATKVVADDRIYPMVTPPPPITPHCLDASTSIVPAILTGPNPAGYTYTWTAASGASILGSNNQLQVTVNGSGTYSLSITYVPSGCVSMITATVTLCTNVGISEPLNAGSSVAVYPNPVINTLAVATPVFSETSRLAIYSAAGSLIGTYAIVSEKTLVDLQSQPAGLYLIQVNEDGKTVYTTKIFKN